MYIHTIQNLCIGFLLGPLDLQHFKFKFMHFSHFDETMLFNMMGIGQNDL